MKSLMAEADGDAALAGIASAEPVTIAAELRPAIRPTSVIRAAACSCNGGATGFDLTAGNGRFQHRLFTKLQRVRARLEEPLLRIGVADRLPTGQTADRVEHAVGAPNALGLQGSPAPDADFDGRRQRHLQPERCGHRRTTLVAGSYAAYV